MAIGSLGTIAKIPELKRRVIFTLLMLLVYRVGVHVPTPGINTAILKDFFERYQQTLFGVVDMFTGGAMENFSVFSLGIMPYISASIILQLLTMVIPHLERLSKEGEAGRKKITQYTRYGTVGLSLIQGMGISIGLAQTENMVYLPKFAFVVLSMITLTAGTAFIMWLGEQITERGIGNGISLIIFAGIVARMPSAIGNTIQLVKTGDMGFLILLLLLAIMVLVIGIIVFVERGQRRIPVTICEASGREARLWRPEYSPPVKGEYCWRHTTDFRIVLDHFSGDDSPVPECAFSDGPHQLAKACYRSLRDTVRRVDHLFLLFLHGCHVQPR